MIKKILLSLLTFIALLQVTHAQPLTISGLTTSGRFSTCAIPPTITATFTSGTGTSVVGGQLVCNDPCGTTTIHVQISNIRWDQNPGANWIHGIFFPANAGFTLTNQTVPAGWAPFATCTGSSCSNGTTGGVGYYFDGTTGQSCCPGNAVGDGIPANNYGDVLQTCSVPSFSFGFDLTLCNSTLTTASQIFKIRGTADGNTGCWSIPDVSFNQIQFSIGTVACTSVYNPLPSATVQKDCTGPTVNYTATLTGGCGNGNTVTWWDAASGGNQVGTGSPFVYDPPGATCPTGTTLYAACCPVGNTCLTRKAFLISAACPAALAITAVSTTDPNCTTPTGSINGVTTTGGSLPITYTLTPGPVSNQTGIFTGLTGTNYTLTLVDAGGCTASTPVTFIPNASVTPAPTVTTPVTYCQGATAVALTATGTNLLWYTTAVGGVGSATAPTPSTATVGSTIYYVTQTSGTCESPRAAITVNVNATPAAPTVVSPVNYCQNDPAVALTATGTNLLWYTVAVGGVGSATAPTPSTATIGSTTWYVSSTTGTCEGPRAPITVNITAPPAAPTVTTPVVYCQGATAVALTATGANLLWYTTAVGGVGSATAPTPSTATVGSTIYYVSQTSGTCESPRAAITVTVNSTPAAPTVTTPVIYCQGTAAAVLTATGTNLLWYTVAVGGVGSATAPTPSTTTVGSTIYYVSSTTGTCEGPRAAITVTVNTTPAAPTVTTPVTYCQNATAIPLTATGTNLLWYTTAVGGVGSATAPTPSTTTVGSTNYYVSQTTGTCEGPRALITVTINILPAAPTVTTPVVYCQGATAVALTATGTNLLWYTAATGGVGSATAPTPSTAAAGTTSYYVSQTTGTCEGPRAQIDVNITATPAAPTITTPVAYCQGAAAVPLTATGTNLLWYTVAVGGVGSATAPTPSTAAGGSTTYYVSQTVSTCESPRAAIVVNVTATPAAPTVTTPVVYCQGATAVALTATGTNLLWYTTAVGGVGSATAPTPSTAAAGSTTYYVSQTTGVCEGPRAAITVNITALPAAPTVTTPVVYCQGATAVALTATGSNLLWYTAATGGVGSATAPTPSTAAAGTTSYYVSQTNLTCEGPRAQIDVTINPTPAAPTVTSPVAYCQGAAAVPLTATGTNLLWYTVAVGGVGSATAPTPSTAAGGSTIYYVSQTALTCEGPRAAITVNVTATPAAPTVTSPVVYCQGATALALTATGTNLLWYTTAVGGVGSAAAPTPSTATAGSTTYYVSQSTNTCEGPRAAITVNITALPAAPTVSSPVVYCQGATAVALTATGSNLLWYTAATGGVGSATAPTPSTAAAGTTSYYVSQTSATCEGPRAQIDVTINPTPAAPAVTSPVAYCQGAAAVPLTATGTNLLWYTVAVGGVGSATAPTPSTAAGGSVTYYVSQSAATCEGPRAAIVVNVTATPAAPTVTSPVVYCQGTAAAVLTATGTNLLWYTTAVGGVGSATAPTPSTAAVGSTTYYVSQSTGTCEGPRASITVTINITPAAPTVTSPVVYCQGATAVALTATGTNLLWYTAATGGVGSATAPTPSTATAGTTSYYVSQTTGTCEGPRAQLDVTIDPTPAAPTVTSPVVYCQGATAVPLTATGTNLLWYTTAVGGVGSATAPTPSTATVGSTIYYVSQTTGVCEGPRAAITVNVTIVPPAPTVTSPVVYCQGVTAVPLTATGTNLLWYTTAVGGVGSATAPTPSTTTVGNTDYYVSQTTGTCEGPRALITVTINITPAAPTVTTPVVYCQDAVAVPLTATGTNLLWYTTATGGVGSATAPTPSTTTPGSTDYYVSQTTGVCEGPRALITVTINPTPALPGVTSPVEYCQNAPAVPLTATGTNLLWYTTAVGGVGSATAPTPSTAAGGSTIYYVSQTALTCEGPRAAITVNVTATPAAPVVTTPVVYCQDATAVPLTATGTNLLWYTTAVGGVGSATAPTPSTTTAGSTNYYVSQSTNTCEGPRALITVTVNPTPALPSVTTPIVYCQNATAVPLTATGTNLLWYTTATGGVGSATAPTPSTVTPGLTTYYVSQTNLSCEGPRAAIDVNVVATPAAPTVVSPIHYCPNDPPTQLTATGTNLLWYNTAVGGVGSATAPTPITSTPGTTSYYVSQTTTLGSCEGPRAQIDVIVNNTLTVNLGNDTTICQGDTVHFIPIVSIPATVYAWRSITPNVPNSTISSLNTLETTVRPVDTVQYVLRTTVGGCSAEDTVQVNVRWKPIVEAGNSVAICLLDSTLLSGVITHTSGPITTYSWTPTDSLTTPDAIQTYAHPTKSTWYRLSAITTVADYGCDFTSYDSVKVVVQPVIHAFAGNDTIAVSGVPHNLHGTGGSSYTWSSPTAVISNPNSQNATSILTSDANFFLEVRDAVGCVGYDSVFVKLYDGPTFYIPTAFSPNGDGLNDVLRPIPAGISTISYFRVFNRYGEVMFETTQYLKGWDGTFGGKPQPSGTYVWMVAGMDRNKKMVEMKGTTLLIR